jgi:hypothetical protein
MQHHPRHHPRLKNDPKLSDPLEQFCAEDPSADECRVYED